MTQRLKRIYFASDQNVKNWLDKACHVRTVYNAIDFSYRQSVDKTYVEKSKMADTVPVAMEVADGL